MAIDSEQPGQDFRLGDLLVQPSLNRISGPRGEAHLEPKVMAVLVCLARHAGQLVSRSTLYDAVWGRTVVSDQALTNCISELRQHLGDDRAEPRYIETVPKRGYRLVAPITPGAHPEAGTGSRSFTAGRRLPVAVLAGAVLALGSLALWLRSTDEPTGTTVVVVPFQNSGNERDLDYLRLALPDEITTLLMASPDLIVRSFEHSSDEAPLAVGRERSAGHVITGHYYLEASDRLAVTVEAQDVAGERLVWRARISAPAGDLLGLREQLAGRVSRGLLPALGASGAAFASQPASREAYDHYLRALALPRHPDQTERALGLLQQAVDLDPGFAPAWVALGIRWYEHGNYGEGGEAAREQALSAYQKALELDPAAIPASVGVVNMRTESGDLREAWLQARRLAEGFSGNAEAHLALAYVYRFGGMLDDSQHHCETALSRDPHNPRLRSCAYSFLYAGELDRVQAFLDLDKGSYFSQWGTVLLNLRRRDDAAALDAARAVSPGEHTRRFMEPCLEGSRGVELDDVAAAFVSFWSGQRDPELAYALAPMLEYCGRRSEALAFLGRAIDGRFCAWPALDQDPVWGDDIREDAAFQRLRSDAIACHEAFREIVASG